MNIADFRSDTLTQPTPSMRRAMASAPVGDDVFGEDPTVNALEALAADRLNKEASLLVPSGTMANLIAQLVHCARGEEVIVGSRSHTFTYELGGCSALGGIHPRTVPNQEDGTLLLTDLEAAIRPEDFHCPRSRLMILENTHNLCGGTPLTPAYTASVAALAHASGMALHVDGARLFNAAVALSVRPTELVAEADSVAFCLSKGLAAPVGSLLCGSSAFISEARRVRKMLGGGMRQAGVFAAAGIVALNDMVDRLAEDHVNARLLAEGLARIPGLEASPGSVHTNIVFFSVTHPTRPASWLVSELEREGIRMLSLSPRQIRAVTHYQVTRGDVERTLLTLARLMS